MKQAKSIQGNNGGHQVTMYCLISMTSFVAGFGIAVWVVHTGHGEASGNARMSNTIPAVLQHLAPEWLGSADTTNVGELIAVTAGEKYGCNAIVYPRSGKNYPLVYFLDENADGIPNFVSIYGRNGRHIVVEENKGVRSQ